MANHLLNAASSRSHALLSVVVRRKVGQVGQGAETSETTTNASTNASTNDRRVRVLKGKLLLVDLAGSERVGKSGAEGQTFDEAIAINLHLHALGKCIAALASNAETTSSAGSPSQNGASTHHHIPYRESKLTRLLKDSLGGTAMTSLIVTASPGVEHLSETVAALNFGQRALKVTNSLVVKQEVDYRLSARRLQEEVDALTARLERCEVELAAKTALAKRRDAHVRVDDRDEPEPPPDASDAGGIDPATSGFDPVVRLSVNVDPIAALDLVGREELECVEKELAVCKQKLAQREDELVQLCVAKEASDEKCDALRLELDSEAQNSLLRSRAVEAKYHAERAELERRWEEDESDRLGREDTWRRELETARNERDELVDAALAERTRWDAEMAAERTKHVAERAEWESERAALVSAAEAAASASEAASARAADALARVASRNAWDTERANLIAELDADRAAYAAAQTAEVAELRRAHAEEVHNLRDALECAERALEAADSRRAEEVDALRTEFDDRLRETIATKDSERSELAASAEDEKARLRASLADVVAQSEHAVNDAVQSAYATWRVEELEPAVAAHKADAQKLERELADAESRCSTLSDRCSTDSEARERCCIEVAVLRAKWQTERDARVAEQSSHRRAWAEEQRRLQRRFDDEITVRLFFFSRMGNQYDDVVFYLFAGFERRAPRSFGVHRRRGRGGSRGVQRGKTLEVQESAVSRDGGGGAVGDGQEGRGGVPLRRSDAPPNRVHDASIGRRRRLRRRVLLRRRPRARVQDRRQSRRHRRTQRGARGSGGRPARHLTNLRRVCGGDEFGKHVPRRHRRARQRRHGGG